MGVILFSWQLSAQLNPEKIKLGVMAGYAFYQQDDLKSVNREILSQLPFESQIIDNFDPVFFFGRKDDNLIQFIQKLQPG